MDTPSPLPLYQGCTILTTLIHPAQAAMRADGRRNFHALVIPLNTKNRKKTTSPDGSPRLSRTFCFWRRNLSVTRWRSIEKRFKMFSVSEAGLSDTNLSQWIMATRPQGQPGAKRHRLQCKSPIVFSQNSDMKVKAGNWGFGYIS